VTDASGTSRTSDETQVRTLIEEWARAISSGDRGGILAHHSSDMLMFDFPPPVVRGLDAYDRTWDFFYAKPKGPISFVPSDLEVNAGGDVAFASCLIHCEGTSAGPVDLRLTVGLRKIDGDWTVLHEHHSVPTQEQRLLIDERRL
jgi:ketosteroid isomerase-like protein